MTRDLNMMAQQLTRDLNDSQGVNPQEVKSLWLPTNQLEMKKPVRCEVKCLMNLKQVQLFWWSNTVV